MVMFVFSEFGRRVRDNGSGTDHGAGGGCFAFGPSIRGGQYGLYPDTRPEALDQGDLVPQPGLPRRLLDDPGGLAGARPGPDRQRAVRAAALRGDRGQRGLTPNHGGAAGGERVMSTKTVAGRTWHFSHSIGHHVGAEGFTHPLARGLRPGRHPLRGGHRGGGGIRPAPRHAEDPQVHDRSRLPHHDRRGRGRLARGAGAGPRRQPLLQLRLGQRHHGLHAGGRADRPAGARPGRRRGS